MAAAAWLTQAFVTLSAAIIAGVAATGLTIPYIPSPNITRIAFGSCSKQSAPQPIWDAILEFDPEIFIWMGDNIYGDNKRPIKIFGKERTVGPWKNVGTFFPSSKEEMRRRYQLARDVPGYAALRKKATVIGTWDDHDFGLNDAGKEFSGKHITQQLFLDFLDEAQDSPRRKQKGVYAPYLFGSKGKNIKVIILDTRYHRDPLSSNGDVLGDAQWAWLEKELYSSPTEITIIVSSIQVISNISSVTSPFFDLESWGRFPKERDKLFRLISESKRQGIFFISGDVHFGEINRYECACEYPLYDITSSGLTQAVEESVPPPLPLFVRVAAFLTPTTFRFYGSKCRRRSCTYGKPNFGVIEINWDANPQKMKIELRDLNGDSVLSVDILLSDLHIMDLGEMNKMPEQDRHRCSLERDLPWFVRYRLAIMFFTFLFVLFLILIALSCTMITLSKKCIKKCKIE